MDRKFAYFFITGDASVQLPSDSLSGTNFKLSSDNLYGTEGVGKNLRMEKRQLNINGRSKVNHSNGQDSNSNVRINQVYQRVEKFAAALIQLHKSTSTENYKTEIDSLSLSLLGREEATSVTRK